MVSDARRDGGRINASVTTRRCRTAVGVLARTAFVCSALFCVSWTSAETTPASLTAGERSIEALLRAPAELAPGKYEVMCEGVIRASGRAHRVACYAQGDAPSALITAVRLASKRAHFNPAVHDGAAIDVYMVWMAHVTISQSGELVLVAPNNGVERGRYGLLYTAPQRLNEFMWRGEKMHRVDLMKLKRLKEPRRRSIMWQVLDIDEHGRVISRRIEDVAGVTQRAAESIDLQISRMKFIAGRLNGKPAPMLYVEPIYW